MTIGTESETIEFKESTSEMHSAIDAILPYSKDLESANFRHNGIRPPGPKRALLNAVVLISDVYKSRVKIE